MPCVKPATERLRSSITVRPARAPPYGTNRVKPSRRVCIIYSNLTGSCRIELKIYDERKSRFISKLCIRPVTSRLHLLKRVAGRKLRTGGILYGWIHQRGQFIESWKAPPATRSDSLLRAQKPRIRPLYSLSTGCSFPHKTSFPV